MFVTLKLKNIVSVICILTIMSGFAIWVSAEAQGVEVPIIMYHSILKDNSASTEFIVTPSQLEEDLKYIKEKGYTAVTVADLIGYVYDNKPLPSKPIMLTFDDGHYNNYHYAYPLMKKYDMKMVVSVVGRYTDMFTEKDDSNPNYSYLTWEQIDEMQKSGFVEFQNHTYDLHSITAKRHGCKKNKGESLEEYKKVLTEDLTKLQNKLYDATTVKPNAFTYPFGGISNASCDIIKELGFKASFSCRDGVSVITKDPECLYMLKRCKRPSGESSKKFFDKILKSAD